MLRQSLVLIPKVNKFVRYNSTEAYTNAILSLKKDLKRSMIAKNDLEKNTIKGLLSEIKNKEIDNKTHHNDEFMLFETYSKLIKQRKDSIENFLANERSDMAEKEQKEFEILKKYQESLPVASKEEIDEKVLTLLKDIKELEPTLQLKQVFSKVNWKTIPEQWKCSSNTIRSSIVAQYKSIFS